MDISAAFLKGMTFKDIARHGRLRQLLGKTGPVEGHVGTERCSASIQYEVKPVSSRDWLPTRSHR
eukprot:12600429-Prorocentrum_lima.AAC.1